MSGYNNVLNSFLLNKANPILFFSRLVSHALPPEAKTPVTRFRWWQPQHSGKGYDQWAIDEILLGQYGNIRMLEDDFDVSEVFIVVDCSCPTVKMHLSKRYFCLSSFV